MAIGLFVASALAFATPANNPGGWLSDRDYPAGALRRREEGTVGFRLLISPKGRVVRCEVTQSSNSADLDAATCGLIVAHARFKPATDEAGSPGHNFYNGYLSWVLPGRTMTRRLTPPALPSPDIEIAVLKLPNGEREKAVWLITKMDVAGQMVACEPSQLSRKDVKLVNVACTQAKALPGEITTDDHGNPVSLIRGLSVLFKAAD